MGSLPLSVLPQRVAICQLDPDAETPDWLSQHSFWSVTRTDDELSVVLCEERVPRRWKAEKGWRSLQVLGPLDFRLTRILPSLGAPLAEAGISIFAISTYDTDYDLVRDKDLDKAKKVLSGSGHVFRA